MALSEDIISLFVKNTKDDNKTKSSSSVYGTTVTYEGKTYVRLDGSDLLTPVISTSTIKDGDRVTVKIENHSATVTGNVSDPSASSATVEKQGGRITEFEYVMAYKVTTDDLEAVNASIEKLKATAARIENADIVKAEIESLEAEFAEMEYVSATELEAITAKIVSIEATFGTFTDISTEDLEAVNAEIANLKGYTAEFTYLNVGVLSAMEADIKKLDVDKLSAENAKITYAQIDFANIGEAAIKKLFTDSGIIKDLVMSNGTITGELVGVTLKGDLIQAGTIVADKLIVKNSKDGLYYKLNVEAGAEVAEGITEEDLQNGLHGTAIIAKSITAEKISVDDLVAFGATIAGFNIVGRAGDIPGAIYSGVKSSVNNTTEGVYLDDSGQMNVGNASSFVKFYKDENGSYRLNISADSVVFGGSGMDAESELINVAQGVVDNQEANSESSVRIEDLKRILQQVITDENGQSLMITTKESYTLTDEVIDINVDGFTTDSLEGATTATGEAVWIGTYSDGTEVYYSNIDGVAYKVTYSPETYTFNISDLESAIAATNTAVSNLSNKTDNIDGTVSQMVKTVTDLALIGGYIVIDEEYEVENEDGTKDTVPAIILGESNSEFKVIITNKYIAFSEGTTIPAYISGQTFIAQNVEVKQELKQGGFSWVSHDGNYGLIWRGYPCSICLNLSNEITSSHTETTVDAESSFNTTLTANAGYVIESVVVTANGKDITDDVVTNNIFSCDINIPRVIGDVDIKASSAENLWNITSRTFADENIDSTTYAKVGYSTATYNAIRTTTPIDDTTYIGAINITDDGELEITNNSWAGWQYVELLFDLDAGSTYNFYFEATSEYTASSPVVGYGWYSIELNEAYLNNTVDIVDGRGNVTIEVDETAFTSILFQAVGSNYISKFSNIALYKLSK